MMYEINRDWYCSAGFYEDGVCELAYKNKHFDCNPICKCKHRKWPTPEQYREEYVEEWTGAVYAAEDYFSETGDEWEVCESKELATIDTHDVNIVCACTRFGKPDRDWRPE